MGKNRHIILEKFRYLKESISLLDTMVHLPLEDKNIVVDSPELTAAIEELRIAVIKFEKDTGLHIEVI